jgi:methyltransferase
MALFFSLFVLLITERLIEMWLSGRNTARLTRVGAIEFGSRHYPFIVLMHVLFFSSMLAEFLLGSQRLVTFWPLPSFIFLVAQLLRLWVMTTMRSRWTLRILIVPGEQLLRVGPYKYLHHPVYLAVVLELFSLPLIFGLWYTAIIFGLGNIAMLLLVRIPAENRGLELGDRVGAAD